MSFFQIKKIKHLDERRILPAQSKSNGGVGFFFDLEIFVFDPPRLGEVKLLLGLARKHPKKYP